MSKWNFFIQLVKSRDNAFNDEIVWIRRAEEHKKLVGVLNAEISITKSTQVDADERPNVVRVETPLTDYVSVRDDR